MLDKKFALIDCKIDDAEVAFQKELQTLIEKKKKKKGKKAAQESPE